MDMILIITLNYNHTKGKDDFLIQNICSILFYILSILFAIYGLIIKSVGSGTSFYMVWIVISLLFFCFQIFINKKWYIKVPKSLMTISFVSLSFIFLFFVIVEIFIFSGFKQEEPENIDYIIILGAQVKEEGPSVVLRYRLDKAVEYLLRNPETKCIVSGGQGSNEPFPEALGMKDYLLKKEILKQRILVEDQSKNTEENILFSIRLIKDDIDDETTFGIVTNNFHMFRAKQIAKNIFGKEMYGIVADSTLLYLPNNMLREFLALIKFWLFK